jgi:hypothetical protein
MKSSGKATNHAEYAQMFPLCAEKRLSAERAIVINVPAAGRRLRIVRKNRTGQPGTNLAFSFSVCVAVQGS